MLLTVFDSLKRPSPPPKVPVPTRSAAFGYPATMDKPEVLRFYETEIETIGAIAAANMEIPFPPASAENDYCDFWTMLELTLRRKPISFLPD